LPPPPLPPPPPPPPGASTSWETPTAPLADPPPKRRPPRYEPASEPRIVDFSSDPADAVKNPKEKWYGWQILLGLAGSHILLLAGVAAEDPVLVFTGTAGHFLSGPITHWANGMVGRGFASVGLNLGLPFGTSLVGAGLDAASGGFVITGFLVGGAIGFVVAPIIDFGALAYKPIEEEGEAQAGVPRFNLTPIVGQGQTGLSFSMQF
jgi:hypothetical protein